MSIVVVQDANVFIDLQTAHVLDVFFRMDWECHTTDAVLDEVEESLENHVREGRLRVRRLSGDELAETGKNARKPWREKRRTTSCLVLRSSEDTRNPRP